MQIKKWVQFNNTRDVFINQMNIYDGDFLPSRQFFYRKDSITDVEIGSKYPSK